jgi:hypothetical protein
MNQFLFQREKHKSNKSLSLKSRRSLFRILKKDSKLKICVPEENTPSYRIHRLVSGSEMSSFKIPNAKMIPINMENFTKCQNFIGGNHEEIKEEVEISSSNNEEEFKRPRDYKRTIQSSKLVTPGLSGHTNPFVHANSNSASKKSGCTPDFKAKSKSNVFSFNRFKTHRRKDSVDYNEPSRYLYEFFSHKKFVKFRTKYISFSQKIGLQKKPNICSMKRNGFNKKHLFIEILNTLVLIRSSPHPSLPILCEISGELAETLGVLHCYVYCRPFTRCLLYTLVKRFQITVYSVLKYELLKYIVDKLQKDRICITTLVSTENQEEIKKLDYFWSHGSANPSNSVIVDHDPRTAAVNCGNAVPIIEYKGHDNKDSILLYLEKYLLDLSLYDDVRGKLQGDFGIGIRKVKKLSTNIY